MPEGTVPSDSAAGDGTVTLHVFGVPRRHVPTAIGHMAADRRPLQATSGVRFAKLLGTGDGSTFTLRDADLGHWAVLAVWDDAGAATAFERSRLVRRWDAISAERLRVTLRPVSSRGRWAGREPFGSPVASRSAGPVAAITRARIRPRMWRTFWRSVPPVSADLRGATGLRLALGIGEAPVGLQGTFSLWESAEALVDFAHRGQAHRDAVRRTAELDWYAEELFARFAVLDVDGTYQGRRP